jgi:hypothetical protein
MQRVTRLKIGKLQEDRTIVDKVYRRDVEHIMPHDLRIAP